MIQQQQDPATHDSKSAVKSGVVGTVLSITRTDAISKNLNLAGSRNQATEGATVQPANDIFVRARDLGIRIWSLDSTHPNSPSTGPTSHPFVYCRIQKSPSRSNSPNNCKGNANTVAANKQPLRCPPSRKTPWTNNRTGPVCPA